MALASEHRGVAPLPRTAPPGAPAAPPPPHDPAPGAPTTSGPPDASRARVRVARHRRLRYVLPRPGPLVEGEPLGGGAGTVEVGVRRIVQVARVRCRPRPRAAPRANLRRPPAEKERRSPPKTEQEWEEEAGEDHRPEAQRLTPPASAVGYKPRLIVLGPTSPTATGAQWRDHARPRDRPPEVGLLTAGEVRLQHDAFLPLHFGSRLVLGPPCCDWGPDPLGQVGL